MWWNVGLVAVSPSGRQWTAPSSTIYTAPHTAHRSRSWQSVALPSFSARRNTFDRYLSKMACGKMHNPPTLLKYPHLRRGEKEGEIIKLMLKQANSHWNNWKFKFRWNKLDGLFQIIAMQKSIIHVNAQIFFIIRLSW